MSEKLKHPPPVKVERRTAPSYRPRTPLGLKLWEIRKRIVASGEPLLGWDDIEREVAERVPGTWSPQRRPARRSW